MEVKPSHYSFRFVFSRNEYFCLYHRSECIDSCLRSVLKGMDWEPSCKDCVEPFKGPEQRSRIFYQLQAFYFQLSPFSFELLYYSFRFDFILKRIPLEQCMVASHLRVVSRWKRDLPTTDYQLSATSYQLPTTNYQYSFRFVSFLKRIHLVSSC